MRLNYEKQSKYFIYAVNYLVEVQKLEGKD
jgi:hypothetical protein